MTLLRVLAILAVGAGFGHTLQFFPMQSNQFIAQARESEPESVADILSAYAIDFREDPMASRPITFGIRVKDATPSDWHVICGGRAKDHTVADVELIEGFPQRPTAYFITDKQTLAKLASGEMASLTAMGKAFSTDFAPLDIEVMDGFQPQPEYFDHLIQVSFHFWTRGFPEVVRFGDTKLTRELHGGNAVLFYYQKGFRSGWFQIEEGQHVNKDESMQTNPFPSLIVMTRGALKARIGGKESTISEGEAIYVGSGVSHEFWNDGGPPGEGILLMFGEGA